jgi:hypothetical protein
MSELFHLSRVYIKTVLTKAPQSTLYRQVLPRDFPAFPWRYSWCQRPRIEPIEIPLAQVKQIPPLQLHR